MAEPAQLSGPSVQKFEVLDSSRHSLLVRVTHWIYTLSFFGLVLSGLAIILAHPRLYWGETGAVGAPSLIDLPVPFVRDIPIRGPGRYVHYLSAWICVTTGLIYVLAGTFTQHFRRNLLPKRKHFSWHSISQVVLDHLHNPPNVWWESIDMADALHPQTLLAYGMNGSDLPIPHGAPLRLKVPRQLGYKNTKYLHRVTVTDSVAKIGKGLGGAFPEDGYSWYAGI